MQIIYSYQIWWCGKKAFVDMIRPHNLKKLYRNLLVQTVVIDSLVIWQLCEGILTRIDRNPSQNVIGNMQIQEDINE